MSGESARTEHIKFRCDFRQFLGRSNDIARNADCTALYSSSSGNLGNLCVRRSTQAVSKIGRTRRPGVAYTTVQLNRPGYLDQLRCQGLQVCCQRTGLGYDA